MTLALEGLIHAPIGWTIHYLFTGTHEHVSDCAGRRYATTCERRRGNYRLPKARNNQHRRQVSPVSFALRWSRRQQRMDYRSIFLSASYGRKVASMRLAVSPKGAQGIAQFMPRTADWRGLNNPFDVSAALKASANYLRDLRSRFGNLGLAAAAYNAGPQRVQDWLSGRGGLPKETRHYVQIVTGHSVEEWTGGTTRANLELPEPMPCRDVPKVGFRTAARSDSGIEKAPANNSFQAKPGWGVQLIGSPSQASALASFQQMQKAYKNLLMARQPLVIRSEVGTSGSWYRVRVVLPTVAPTPKDCAPAFARRAAAVWCSAIDRDLSL